jgi:hypothetical protein
MVLQKLLPLLFFIAISSQAQNSVLLGNKDGLEITYTAQKTGEEDKKDKWSITVTVINRAGETLYYPVRARRNADGTYMIESSLSEPFAQCKINNTQGFLATNLIELKGDRTGLFTQVNNSLLYKIDMDRTYQFTKTISIKKGENPSVSINYMQDAAGYNRFGSSIGITDPGAIAGQYNTTCGTLTFYLSLINNGTVIQQSFFGKNIRWLKGDGARYYKEGSPNTYIIYNRSRNSFSYSNEEGMACEWMRGN